VWYSERFKNSDILIAAKPAASAQSPQMHLYHQTFSCLSLT